METVQSCIQKRLAKTCLMLDSARMTIAALLQAERAIFVSGRWPRLSTGLKLQGSIGKFGKVELSDICAVDEMPDGKVVSGTETGSLLLWEGNFIKCRFVQVGGKQCHEEKITYIELDRKEKCLITAAADGMIRWWDYEAIDSAEVDADITLDFELFPVAEYRLGKGTRVNQMVDCGTKGSTRTFVIHDADGKAQVVKFQLSEEGGSLSKSVAALAGGDEATEVAAAPETTVLSSSMQVLFVV